MRRSELKSDSGTSVLLEYIISLCILAILFSVLMLTLNNTIKTSNNIVLDNQLEIIANDIANRISIFSSGVSMGNTQVNSHYTTIVYSASADDNYETFELPPLAQGDEYNIEIMYDAVSKTGAVKVTYMGALGQNSKIEKTVMFSSKIAIDHANFMSTSGKGIIRYDSAADRIYVVG